MRYLGAHGFGETFEEMILRKLQAEGKIPAPTAPAPVEEPVLLAPPLEVVEVAPSTAPVTVPPAVPVLEPMLTAPLMTAPTTGPRWGLWLAVGGLGLAAVLLLTRRRGRRSA
ncbi:MAG: hypothetical protein Q8Q14_14050 [Gemmatimonadales bacterium]|nr:hypothetical protein [Gemmatimonadales bacterium]